MRKLLTLLAAVAIALAAPLVAPPSAPVVGPEVAEAADWIQSGCRHDVWYLVTGSGVFYWLDGHSETYGAHFLPHDGEPMSSYRWNGYECGWLGAPVSNAYQAPGNNMEMAFEGGWIWWCCWY